MRSSPSRVSDGRDVAGAHAIWRRRARSKRPWRLRRRSSPTSHRSSFSPSTCRIPATSAPSIRAAEAGGASGVVLAGASADPWGWKALRAAMGSTFRLPVLNERDPARGAEATARGRPERHCHDAARRRRNVRRRSRSAAASSSSAARAPVCCRSCSTTPTSASESRWPRRRVAQRRGGRRGRRLRGGAPTPRPQDFRLKAEATRVYICRRHQSRGFRLQPEEFASAGRIAALALLRDSMFP